jgi:hypothetical protein
MSDRASATSPHACSGVMWPTVPIRVPASVPAVADPEATVGTRRDPGFIRSAPQVVAFPEGSILGEGPLRGAPVANKTAVVSGFLALLVAAPPAHPDEPWRLVVGPSLFLPGFSTTYVSAYAPPFEYVSHTSTATQTMPLDAGTGPGVLLGVERALGRHIGLQVSAHYGAAGLSGAPGEYDLSMRYTSRPPPSYDPMDVSLQRSEAQPAADGRFKTLAMALDLVAWTDLGARARLGVSAGPAWLWTKGRAESLVYTAYFMGGHSTSFSED